LKELVGEKLTDVNLKQLIGISLDENGIKFYNRISKPKSSKLLAKVYLSLMIPKTHINGRINPSNTWRILKPGCSRSRVLQIFEELESYGIIKKAGTSMNRRAFFELTILGKTKAFIEIAEERLGLRKKKKEEGKK